MRGSLVGVAASLAIGACAAVAIVAAAFFVAIVPPLFTEPDSHAAEDATFGLIVFAPLWIAGVSSVALALGLWLAWAGRPACLVWAAWTAIAGVQAGAVVGFNGILVAVLSHGPEGAWGYDLERLDLYIPVVLWIAAAAMLLAIVLPSPRHTPFR